MKSKISKNIKNYSVRYIGVVKITDTTPLFLFSYLTIGKIYKIQDTIMSGGLYYYLIPYGDEKNEPIWYPYENFELLNFKDEIKYKYDLR